MSITEFSNKQSGTALVFSLLILLILTIVGVASMSNTQMQERMAGNVNLQSIAFEAASSGISQALEFGVEQRASIGCDRGTTPWQGSYADFVPVDLTLSGAQQNLTVQYQLKADCLEEPGFGPDPDDPTYDPPVQMYVTSRGFVSAAGDNGGLVELVDREIEVRIDSLRTDGRSAIRAEGESEVIFGAANSNRFSVDGAGGPAISTTTLANAQEIATEIGADRLGNYDGGVVRSDYDSPFNSAWRMARFALEIRAFMEFHGYTGTSHTSASACNSIAELQSQNLADDLGEDYLTDMALINGNFSIGGSTDFTGVTYVTGNLTMNGTPRGNGLIIVEGDVQWSGKADFQGAVIALGGLFEISGGGSGETDGTIYAANIDMSAMQSAYNSILREWDGVDYDCWSGPCLDSDGNVIVGASAISDDLVWADVLARLDQWGNPSLTTTGLESTKYEVLDDGDDFGSDGFGPITMDFSGGGNHTVVYDCKKIDDFRRVLSECGETPANEDEASVRPGTNGFEYDGLADPWSSQLCNTPGEGGELQAIRSWRENLGWRELLSGS